MSGYNYSRLLRCSFSSGGLSNDLRSPFIALSDPCQQTPAVREKLACGHAIEARKLYDPHASFEREERQGQVFL